MLKRNRRKFTRLTTHHLIKYRILDNTEVVSFARNISAGGLLFYADEPIPVGSIIEIIINFPGRSAPIKARAKVLRAKILKKIGGALIGVQFINISAEDARLISDRIARTLRGRKQPKVKQDEPV